MLGIKRATDCVVSDGKGPKLILLKTGSLVFSGAHGQEDVGEGMARLIQMDKLFSDQDNHEPEAEEIKQNIEKVLRIARDISGHDYSQRA